MFRTPGSRIAIAAASAVIIVSTVAAASPAQAVAVGPHQPFTGEVWGHTAPSVIDVSCLGIATIGHPVPGQTVEVALLIPPVTTGGYTGDSAVEIDAALIFPTGPVTGKIPIATFTQYFVKLAIPASITVPCSGSAVMQFSPYPDVAGTPSDVTVTFESSGAGG
jgi:membrane-associated protease RseP (regulator of RpoE activity)